MRIHRVANYQELSKLASELILKDLSKKPNLLFGAATGGSPTGMYANLVNAKNDKKADFSQMRVLKLDEWGILSMNHPDSCRTYVQQHILSPLEISADRYTEFTSEVSDLASECARIQNELDNNGPLDICILGLGKNGHIGFNEPAPSLQLDCHKAILAESTIAHDPALSQGPEPAFGLTIGLKGIFAAKRVIFLLTGKGKQEAIRQVLSGNVSTNWPGSFLWLHPNVDCILDESVV